MLWLFLIVGVIVASFTIPGFRRFVAATVVLILVLAAAVALWLLIAHEEQAAEREAAKARIRESEIELVDLRMGPGYGSSFNVVGRVRNRSARYTLSELRLKFTMSDCVENRQCEIVGESVESIYLGVPPGQARDLDRSVYFSYIGKPRGKREWTYEVVEVLGK